MRKFVIADTHFGDGNIIRFENRPFDNIEDMDEVLIKKWNSVVAEDDIVFHLGDVGNYELTKMKDIVSRLNGKKILVMGNHDKQWTIAEWMECGFDEVYRYPIIVDEFLVMQHEPPQYINDNIPFYYFYGHVHGTKMYQNITSSSACACVERWEYKPVDIESVLRTLR